MQITKGVCLLFLYVTIVFCDDGVVNKEANETNKVEFTPHFITITKLAEAPSYVRKPMGDSRVCRYNEEVRMEICKEALEEGFVKRFQFKLSKSADMGRETVYRVQYGGLLSSNNAEETVSACRCPTWPPIYLQDGHEPNEIIILVRIVQPGAKEEDMKYVR